MTGGAVVCPSCNRKVSERLVRCVYCGASLANAVRATFEKTPSIVLGARVFEGEGSPIGSPGRAHGACDYKDWWTTVWVQGPTLAWPNMCACCMGAADVMQELLSGKEKLRTEYPICGACRRHAKIDDVMMGLAVAGGLLIPPTVYLLFFGLRFLRILPMLALYLLAAVLVGGAIYVPLRAIFAKKSERCTERDWPVDAEISATELLGEKNERTDERHLRVMSNAYMQQMGPLGFAIRIRNRAYAERFIFLNGGLQGLISRIDAEM